MADVWNAADQGSAWLQELLDVANKSIALLSAQEQHDLHATLQREIPLGGRMGDVERDLVPMLILLAGPGGGYITGQVINVDGGMLIGSA